MSKPIYEQVDQLLVAFCQINGIPGDSIGVFFNALRDDSGESLMRMAVLICFDGLVPLGANFALKGCPLFSIRTFSIRTYWTQTLARGLVERAVAEI